MPASIRSAYDQQPISVDSQLRQMWVRPNMHMNQTEYYVVLQSFWTVYKDASYYVKILFSNLYMVCTVIYRIDYRLSLFAESLTSGV